MSAHTPGPWATSKAGPLHPQFVTYEGKNVFEVIRGERVPQVIAALNAHDDMLAALEAEQEWRLREAVGELDHDWDYQRMVGNKRRAAIAKATGGA